MRGYLGNSARGRGKQQGNRNKGGNGNQDPMMRHQKMRHMGHEEDAPTFSEDDVISKSELDLNNRNVMNLTGETYLREVQAFPMTRGGQTAVMKAPKPLTDKQLKELGLKVDKK